MAEVRLIIVIQSWLQLICKLQLMPNIRCCHNYGEIPVGSTLHIGGDVNVSRHIGYVRPVMPDTVAALHVADIKYPVASEYIHQMVQYNDIDFIELTPRCAIKLRVTLRKTPTRNNSAVKDL